MISFILLVVLSTFSQSDGCTIKGSIKFDGPQQPSLPDKSWVTVKLEDVSIMDVASTVLGKNQFEVKDYDANTPIAYELDANCTSVDTDASLSLSAVVSLGWRPQGDDWIHKGDYYSTSQHKIQLETGENSYIGEDIKVQKI